VPQAPTRESGTVEPSKTALVCATAFGFTLGLIPYLQLIGETIWLPLVTVVALVGGSLGLRSYSGRSTFEPTLGEWALGLWSSVSTPAVISLMGLMGYASFYWLGRLGVAMFGVEVFLDPSALAKWTSCTWVILCLMVLSAEDAKSLAPRLYPQVAGNRSPYFALLAGTGKLVTVAALVIGIVMASALLLGPGSTAFVVIFTLALLYSSLPLSEIGKDRRTDTAGRRSQEGIRQLFETAGYRAIGSPQTGDPESDPLLKEVDFLAYGGDRVLAVGVKHVEAADGKPSDWSMASPLLSAANLLGQRFTATDSEFNLAVRPLLIVVGGAIAESLPVFAAQEGVGFLHLPGYSAIDEVLLGAEDPEARAERAAQLLKVPRIHLPFGSGAASL
jgi:hypothetical protein